ncbi:MAG: magnesium transporter CorA family protein [Endomicrobium sp.]|jgi:magnesium transporter|nr:magnesium transporter CorA family protein [Endomicrobium sp.]
MLKAIYSFNNEFRVETDPLKIAEVCKSSPKLIWIDIYLENHELNLEETSLLTETFKFHEMSLEDCLFPQYYPKMEEFEDYVFGALHGIQLKPNYYEEFDDSIYELNLFIGKNFVITVHIEELFFLESLFEKAKNRPLVELKNIPNILYNIFNKVVSSYELTLEKIDNKMEELEDEILENPETENMEEILDIKKVIFAMKKIAESQQAAYAYFARSNNNELVKRENLVYFRDIFTQYLRVNQSIVMRSQTVVSLLEVYMSSVTVRLTEVMKFLTIIATILMPVLIISGYYGMNVQFPEYKIFGESGSWYFAVAVIAAAVAAMLIYFKKKKWF